MPEYKKITYKNLVLDSTNPRLPKSMQNSTESEIIKFMLSQGSTLELMLAIGVNDFFAGEQLLVVESSSESGKYIVVEGNRRLTAVKLLNEPALATIQKTKIGKILEEVNFRPTEIPCLIFDEKEEIYNYLGFRHITGIKSWRLLEKSRYVYELKENFKSLDFFNTCREIAKLIGSRRDYICRLIIGYELYLIIEDNDFYGIHQLDDTNFYFNYLADSLTRANIANFIGVNLDEENPLKNLNNENFKNLIQWFFVKNDQNKTRLKGDSTDLKYLNSILGNANSTKYFNDGASLIEAFELTDELNLVFKNYINRSLKSLESADKIVHKISEFPPSAEDNLKALRSLAVKIINFKIEVDNES